MRAKPLKFVPNRGYVMCEAEEATHVELNIPGPFPGRMIPVQTKGARNGTNNWTWNGDTENPTLRPSVLTKQWDGVTCHTWITDGEAQFLPDCTHEYAGQTLPLLEIE